MNIRVDTLEYSNDLQKAGIERVHTEAITKLQARTVGDLIDHELVTRDHLKSELTQTESRLKSEIVQLEARMDTRLGHVEAGLRDEIRATLLQIRALQFGGAIAAFAVAAIVMLSRLIK